MTNQEAYDAILAHFEQDGAVFGWGDIRRIDDNGYVSVERDCVYRGNGDPKSPLRCAFGCLIPDDLYNPGMEGTTASGVLTVSGKYGDLKAHFDGLNLTFLDTIQGMHDRLAREGEYSVNAMQVFIDQLKAWPNETCAADMEITNGDYYDVTAPS